MSTEQSAANLGFFVSGMWCGSCAKTVRDTVAALPEVRWAELNSSTKLLFVTLDEPERVERGTSSVLETVTNMGFGIKVLGSGWLQDFQAMLETESQRAISPTLVALVFFLSMWSSMLAFAGYLGPMTTEEHYLLACLSSGFGVPAVLLGVSPFLNAGWRAWRSARKLTLDLFIGFGGLSATVLSLHHLWSGKPFTYTDSASMILTLLLLAKVADNHLATNLSRQILQHIKPLESGVLTWAGDRWLIREASQLRRGDLVRFEAGETLSIDGRVRSREGRIKTYLLSGEDGEVEVQAGTLVFAGSIAAGSIQVEVEAPLGLRRIDAWAESALRSEGRPHRWSALVDRIEAHLVAGALTGATILALVRWGQTSSLEQAAESFFVGVLLFCPCLFASILPAAKQLAQLALGRIGVHLFRPDCLFDLSAVDSVYLDKTGTLTSLETTMDWQANSQRSRIEALLYKVRTRAPHPLLVGLKLSGFDSKEQTPEITDLKEIPGEGVWAEFSTGEFLAVGRPRFLWPFIPERSPLPGVESAGVVYNGGLVAELVSGQQFTERGLSFLQSLVDSPARFSRLEVLSGDPRPEAGRALCAVAPERIVFQGNLQPEEKATHIQGVSLFVGDGLNDHLALSKATVSCRVGERSAGFGAVDMQLNGADLKVLLLVFDYAQTFVKVVRQTALLALTYNLVAWSLALCGLFSPLGAVFAMLCSLSLMTLSILRLRSLPRKSRGQVSAG